MAYSFPMRKEALKYVLTENYHRAPGQDAGIGQEDLEGTRNCRRDSNSESNTARPMTLRVTAPQSTDAHHPSAFDLHDPLGGWGIRSGPPAASR